MFRAVVCLLLLYAIGYCLLLTLPRFSVDPMLILNERTVHVMDRLVQTKYFRIIRLNLNQQCPFETMTKMCKKKSCAVCRCSDDDIPKFWSTTDRVRSHVEEGRELWGPERGVNGGVGWVWHVQDVANDQGQYFDIYTNIESYSGYNGSYIWQLIYNQNCFKPTYQQQLCAEEQVLFNLISGLHTSISTHLSRFYSDTQEHPMWAALKDDSHQHFRFNHSEYQRRVLDHPNRIHNLFFLYRVLAKAIKQAAPYLRSNFSLTSGNITEDTRAQQQLTLLLDELQHYDLTPKDKQALRFFTADHPKVHQYQRFIHNISNILNCVECQKCRLFGKMQTYGVGTALKILLGYPTPYKRNQIVALLNVFNKITMSVSTYYRYEGREEIGLYKVADPYYLWAYGGFGGLVGVLGVGWQLCRLGSGRVKKD